MHFYRVSPSLWNKKDRYNGGICPLSSRPPGARRGTGRGASKKNARLPSAVTSRIEPTKSWIFGFRLRLLSPPSPPLRAEEREQSASPDIDSTENVEEPFIAESGGRGASWSARPFGVS